MMSIEKYCHQCTRHDVNSHTRRCPRCIVVAGGFEARDPLGCGDRLRTAEIFDEEFDQWLRLPHDMPHNGGLCGMGSALLSTIPNVSLAPSCDAELLRTRDCWMVLAGCTIIPT